MAKLIFLSADMVESYAALARKHGYAFALNSASIETVRALEANVAYLVTAEELMRGIDYRSKSGQGIMVLIAAPVSNHRAVEQALYRVGRSQEPCERYSLAGLKHLVDADLNRDLTNKLNHTLEKLIHSGGHQLGQIGHVAAPAHRQRYHAATSKRLRDGDK